MTAVGGEESLIIKSALADGDVIWCDGRITLGRGSAAQMKGRSWEEKKKEKQNPPDEHNALGQRTASSPLSLIRPDRRCNQSNQSRRGSCASAGSVLRGHITPAEQIVPN